MAAAPDPVASADPRTDRGARFAALLKAQREEGGMPAAIMGIVNVTPDSFSDGGLFADTEVATTQGMALARAGAAILDIGGESTRRGAEPVEEAQELARVLPVVAGLTASGALLSIDTIKAPVAEAALAAGAHIVNDVRGLQGDPAMAEVAAAFGAGVIAMQNPGLLGSSEPLPGDPVQICLRYFERTLDVARRAGIAADRIALDPGIGFGKSLEQNLALIARLPELASLGYPLLVGASRKNFIGQVTGRAVGDRLIGTLAANVAAVLAGAAIVRVHDVAEHVDALRMAAAIAAQRREPESVICRP